MDLTQLKRIPLPVWYGVAALVGVGAAYWIVKKATGVVGEVAANVGTALDNGAADITSDNNLINRAANQAGHWFFGLDKNNTIGTAIWELFNDDPPLNPPVLNPIAGHNKIGDVWYGYDRQKAREAAQAAASSQIAKDVATYGGGYGALTK